MVNIILHITCIIFYITSCGEEEHHTLFYTARSILPYFYNMQGQDKGTEIDVASDAPSNFIAYLSSNSNRRSPRKACIKTALAATLVVVAAFAIGYGSGIGIQNAANNKNEGLVSSAKNQALQEVPSSAVGSKSSKYSKSAKDDLINALLARVEALEEGQVALARVEALEDGQQALEDGQQALDDALAGVLPCVGYDNSTDVCTIGEDVEAVFIEPKEEIKLSTDSGNAIKLEKNGDIKLNTNTGSLVADIANNITLEAGNDINLASGGDLVADIDGGVTIETEGDINLLAPGGDLNAGIANDIDIQFGTGSSTDNAKAYIGTGPSNDDDDGNFFKITKGSPSNIDIISNLGRVFIKQELTGKRGYLAGTCKNADSDTKKDICQG